MGIPSSKVCSIFAGISTLYEACESDLVEHGDSGRVLCCSDHSGSTVGPTFWLNNWLSDEILD